MGRARLRKGRGAGISGGGGFSLPTGVSLINIDGNTGVSVGNPGSLYYTTKSFTNAANAGFDTTLYPIVAWSPGISPTGAAPPAGIQRVKNFADAGVTVISGLDKATTDSAPNNNNDPSSLTYLGPAGVANGVPSPGVYLIQGMSGDARHDGSTTWMTPNTAETVGYLTCDEPGYWNFATDTIFYDVVNASAGTWISSLTIPTHWQDNKFQWINWEAQLMLSPYNTFTTGHFPALAASTNNFSTDGANWSPGHPSGPMIPSELLYTQLANRDGNLRRIDVTGADIYWMSTQPSSIVGDGIAGGMGVTLGIWDIGLAGISVAGTFINTVGTVVGTFSVPAGSLATSLIETHASDPNHQGLANLIGSTRSATISNATWAATSGGQATFTTTAAHGFVVGQTNVLVFGVNPVIGVNSASWSGGNATLITASAHGFVVGLSITVSGVPSFAGYNGTFTTLSGTTGTNVVYAVTNPGGSAGSGGSVQSAIQYNNVSFPYYTTLTGTTGSTIVVALPATTPGPGNYVSGGTVQATAQMAAPVTAYTPGSPGSMTLGASTVIAPASSDGGSFTGWSINAFTMSPDQQFRGCHYGGMIDSIRTYQSNANSIQTPLFGSVENYNQSPASPAPVGWRAPTPPQYTAACWGNVIHGARGFYTIAGDTVNIASPFYTIQAGNKISIYDCMKSTHYLINTLATVINSPFAEGTLASGYVHVAGDHSGGSTAGFRAPWRPLDQVPSVTPNQFNAYTYTGGPGPNTNGFNRSLASAFEVMAKFYQGGTTTINGVMLTTNKFWLFAAYRGSPADGPNGAAATTITATFTLNNSNGINAPSVDRLYSDGVIGAVSNGAGGTRITTGETQQILNGDTVMISGTSGVPGLNGGPFTVSNTNGTGPNGVRTTFDINLAFSGTFAAGSNGTGFGTLIAFHNITVTSGTTFTDSFPRGDCIGIYRVN